MKNPSKKSAFKISKDVKAFLNSRRVQRFAKDHAGMEGQVSIAFLVGNGIRQGGCVMPRTKPKYLQESEQPQPQPITFMAAGLPYSFDLKGASTYTDFSETDIRGAITSGQLAVISNKPYRILRSDLESWAKSKRHFVRRVQQKEKQAA